MFKMKRKRGGFYCAYKGCKNVSGRSDDISFFRFPKDPERSAGWIKSCGREDLINKNCEELYNSYRICQNHFDNHMFLNDLKNRLQNNACPRAFVGSTHLVIQPEYQPAITFPNEYSTPTKKLKIDKGENNMLLENHSSLIGFAKNDKMEIYHSSLTSIQFPNLLSSMSESNITSNKTLNETVDSQTCCTHSDQIDAEKTNSSYSLPKSMQTCGTQTEKKLSNDTPRKIKLRKQIASLKKKVLRLGKKRISRKTRKTSAVKLDDMVLTSDQINRLIDKTVSGEAVEFVKVQVNHTQQKPKAKRYSKEFKQFCLNLYYSGPKAYKKMKKSFQLVSIRTLQRLTKKVKLRPGVHKNIFEALKLKVENLDDRDKYCTLCVDEMSLKAFLNYDAKTDEVIGLEDCEDGQGKRMKPACTAMVGMLRGLSQPWKQQVFYNLLHTQFSFMNIRNNVIECIRQAKAIGLKLVGIVSDMGSNFVQLAHSLGVSPNNSAFEIDGEEYFYIFDVPHLIKTTRNNLLNNHFLVGGTFTSWDYIKTVYEMGKKMRNPPAPKLTDCRVYPSNFNRMKVKYATQVISQTVASSIETLVTFNALLEEALVTSNFIRKFDNLFDMCNSSSKFSSKEHKKAYTGSDFQVKFLDDMTTFISDLKVYKKTNEFYKDVTNTLTCKEGWIVTIHSIQSLWNRLKDVGFKYLLTRRLNQDPLELFFGTVRSLIENGSNSTPLQFIDCYKKLFFINYSNVATGNCIDDYGSVLMKLSHADREIHIFEYEDEDKNNNVPHNFIQNMLFNDVQESEIIKITEKNVFTFVCGYVVKKTLENHSCDTCKAERPRKTNNS